MSIMTSKLQVVSRNGKPQAVVLDIKQYERLLEAAEEREDLVELRRIKNGKPLFRDLNAYIREHA
ncbi:MAG: type II toxin-antitoxin system prevent-host-death family antitoxin [Candidatus Liptonbacteria bacterium]|nr:type II toxin-antitoxin system prevent-host-death family antitoxin [Candidatus Liptonbacteria bacterium]